MSTNKLPIGIQDFVSIRQDNYLYVDKTELIFKLVNEGKSYFLSRPRRFGKSLLLSTIGAYLEGKKELFSGLALEKLEKEWSVFPVLRFDLNAENYSSVDALYAILDMFLVKYEELYGVSKARTLSGRFLSVIEKAHEKTGKRVAVLIDEYDKPLLQTLENVKLHNEYKQILKSFYGVLKSSDSHLKFAILTGVTKFSQVSVFSDLNQVIDLSMHRDYATLCGITETELVHAFSNELKELAVIQGTSEANCLEKARYWYNGYKFHPDALGVYNPFSTLNLLSRKEFSAFWFATGTPSFLVELLKESDYDLRDIDNVQLSEDDFANYRAEADKPIPVIYQSGYLTIKSYNSDLRLYTLAYPNAEVKYGFLNFISNDFLYKSKFDTGLNIAHFSTEIKSGDPEAFLLRLKTFFSSIPYELNDKTERHYQVVFYLVFKLLGQFVDAEVSSSKGRADAVVRCKDYIYIFEFKLNGSADEALNQIDDRGYLLPYAKENKTMFKIGVAFDAKERNLGEWRIVRS